MKRYLNAAILILFFVLTGVITSLSNEEVCMAKEFDASLYVSGDDRDVTIKINGIHLSMIKGGGSELLQLYLADDPKIKTLPPGMPPETQKERKELFCLKKGENTIEIVFKEKSKPEFPSLFTVEIRSFNYKVPVLMYVKNPDIKEGHAKGTFKIYADEPEGFTTVILQNEEKKQNVTSELKVEKVTNAQYSFDFSKLNKELIRQNYVTVPYKIHKNKLFNFSILMNKNWNGVKVAEPVKLPMDGSLAEIGIFNLYSPSHDPKGEIKAQLIIYITGIPKAISAADYLDKQLPLMFKDQKIKIIQSKTMDTTLGPTKDILFSYSITNMLFLSRICAFKVKDDTKAYLFGEKNLLYLIQMSTQEKYYESSGAEAFYMSKVSFNPGAE
jgi:hypothetical protein